MHTSSNQSRECRATGEPTCAENDGGEQACDPPGGGDPALRGVGVQVFALALGILLPAVASLALLAS